MAAAHLRRTPQARLDGGNSRQLTLRLQIAHVRVEPACLLPVARFQPTILGLGDLKARQSVETLLADLTDSNPSIAQAAAVSLERILGTEAAVSRILETASEAKRQQADMSRTMRLYASALRTMDEKKVVERLETAAVSDVEDQELARLLLVEVGGMHAFQSLRVLTSAVKNYQEALRQAEQAIRTQFEATLREARGDFAVALGMDIIVFVLGIVLLSVSAAQAVGGGAQSTAAWVGVAATGGTGVLGILYGTLVAEPRVQVQQAVDHMMKLKVIFLGYLRQLHQIDQLYTRRMLEIDRKRMAPEEHHHKRPAAEATGHTQATAAANGHGRPPSEAGSPQALSH